jgi:pimeloyl-ACP methyl ester carboxylesterase
VTACSFLHWCTTVKAPVLFIHGADDEYGTVAQLEAVRKGVKGRVEAEVISGCGHVLHQQTEALVYERVISFISNIR